MKNKHCRFTIGQLVRHKQFQYRGVVLDVDPEYQGSDDRLEPQSDLEILKSKPWYYILVHDAIHTAYTAEQLLEPDLSNEAINHPEIECYFHQFTGQQYRPIQSRLQNNIHGFH